MPSKWQFRYRLTIYKLTGSSEEDATFYYDVDQSATYDLPSARPFSVVVPIDSPVTICHVFEEDEDTIQSGPTKVHVGEMFRYDSTVKQHLSWEAPAYVVHIMFAPASYFETSIHGTRFGDASGT